TSTGAGYGPGTRRAGARCSWWRYPLASRAPPAAQLAAVDCLIHALEDVRPEPVAAAAAAATALLLVGALAASLGSTSVRGASLAAAVALLLRAGTGVYRYALSPGLSVLVEGLLFRVSVREQSV